MLCICVYACALQVIFEKNFQELHESSSIREKYSIGALNNP